MLTEFENLSSLSLRGFDGASYPARLAVAKLLGHLVAATQVITVCPKSLELFYVISYYTKWVKTSWTESK